MRALHIHPVPARLPLRAAGVARTALLPLAAAALTACGDDRPSGVTAPAPSLAVTSAASAATASGTAFLFLAPLGPTLSAYHGAFDGSRAPAVEICRLAGAACDGAPVARFTLAEGTGGEPLRVVTAEQHYRADWKEKERPAGAVYRVRVLLDGAELGRGDLRVLRPGETEAAVIAAGYVPVSQSQTVLVRFRLETSADYLPGAPGAPAAAAIPRVSFAARPGDYSTGHPTLPKSRLSHNTVHVVPALGTTTAQLNALLAELDATVVGGVPGVNGVAGGVLTLRLPTTTHAALAAVLTRLGRDARVAGAVQDALLRGQALPGGGAAASWTWEVAPAGGNWGLEAMRVPQMWNLNRAVRRQLALGALVRPVTGILDDGFPVGHEDLAFDTVYTRGSSPRGHGLMVAGAIGATFDNGVGIDGVNPFARMVARSVGTGGIDGDPYQTSISVGQATVYELATLVRAQPTLRVVNSSVGYNWSLDLVDAARDTAAQRIATQHGALLVTVLKSIGAERGGLLPLVVTSAGNDSDGSFGDQPAKWSSPAANAALVHGARNIIVVGAAKQQAGAPGGAERAAYSNTGAHLLAPGSDVLVTVPGGYRAVSGTSFATPYVAGLVSYLYTLAPTLPQPTLTENPMRDLLVGSSTLVRGADGYLANAFDAALLSDGATRSQRVLRLLTDVDDGSLDGNERVRADGTPVLADGVAAGDQVIDMRDFRRWRDWLLQTEGGAEVLLDGAARHPKKDVNDNGRFAADGDDENVYPRGDFNGDGRLSRTTTRAVPGVMDGAEATDLQVLQRLWADPDVPADSLPVLVNSADLHVDASACLAFPGAGSVQSRVWPTSADLVPVTGRPHILQRPTRVYTVPVAGGGRTVAVDVKDAAGKVIASAEKEFGTLPRGADAHWRPACVALTVTPESAQLAPGATRQFAASVAGSADQGVAWTASGGSITAGGLYTAPNTAGTYTVTARHAESGARREALVVVSSAAGARVEPIYHSVLLETSAQFTPTLNDGPQPVSTRRVDHTAGQAVKVRDVAWSDESSLSGGITEVADPTWTPWSASASTKASLALEYTLGASGAVTRVAGSGNARGDASESAAGYMGYALKLGASGAASHDLYFRVVGGPVRFTASYRCTAALQDGFTNGIQSNFLIRSTTTYMPADPAFLYCNAWGKPSVDQTVTGVLEPGEYLLKVNAGAEAFAASWNKDLSVGTAAYQFSVTFQP